MKKHEQIRKQLWDQLEYQLGDHQLDRNIRIDISGDLGYSINGRLFEHLNDFLEEDIYEEDLINATSIPKR